jgi:hypothetical protein
VSIGTDLAHHILNVDPDNTMAATELGYEIALTLNTRRTHPHRVDSADLIGFVKRINSDKTLGAGALADAIVDEFNLDEETR